MENTVGGIFHELRTKYDLKDDFFLGFWIEFFIVSDRRCLKG